MAGGELAAGLTALTPMPFVRHPAKINYVAPAPVGMVVEIVSSIKVVGRVTATIAFEIRAK